VVEIREATEADLGAVAAIHIESWQATYRGIVSDSILDSLSVAERLVVWRQWYVEPEAEIWLAVRSGRPVAFSRLLPAPDNADSPSNAGEVTHLYAAPSVLGHGVGRALFSRVLSAAQSRHFDSLILWVLEDNDRARKFYERFGLRPDGARKTNPDWLGEGVYEIRYHMMLERSAAQQAAEAGAPQIAPTRLC
jgi:ribosomal protein S18 acetylase RimI-like enzyme